METVLAVTLLVLSAIFFPLIGIPWANGRAKEREAERIQRLKAVQEYLNKRL